MWITSSDGIWTGKISSVTMVILAMSKESAPKSSEKMEDGWIVSGGISNISAMADASLEKSSGFIVEIGSFH